MEGNVSIREMKMEDFEEVYALWMQIHGFGIRSIDDSKEGVERFIRRNPTTSMVAVLDGKIIGAILCGHDGRRGCLYHVCVHENYRKHGIGQKMVNSCLEALKKEHICKVNLIAFKKNEVGNRFWQGMGWTFRDDVNYYECILDDNNVTTYNP
ncbi:MAG: GNAT family N-acetyltransferase [Clostridiales bacterium]|nr:GNAT family N-acetyltransferase [Clostridiales bacterium]